MTQQPFSRPGAIDLSALKRPARPAGARGAGPGAGPGGPAGAAGTTGEAAGGAAAAGSAYVVRIDEQTFQATLEASTTAPVVLVFYSPSRMPESKQLADDVATVVGEYDGRLLAGLVDVDAVPAIAQAMQIPSIPLVVLAVDGRPVPLFQDVLPLDQLRATFNQLAQQMTAQGITGRHAPRGGVAPDAAGEGVAAEEGLDPRYAPAEDAMEAGDYARAVAEYEQLVAANPADAEAAGGLAMAQLLLRTQDADPAEARSAADAAPGDVAAQTLAADLDLLDTRVDEAFARLVDLVRRTTGPDRDRARQHLLGLFAAVGTADPRVIRGRQNLASALF